MVTSSIVTYHTDRNELNEAIQSLLRQPEVDLIYIIDNSPTDELSAFVRHLSAKVIYRFGHGNPGYGAGHNIAINQALKEGSQYHIIVNPDISFKEHAINPLIRFMESNPDAGLVMPRIVGPDGGLQYLCKLYPTPLDLFGRRFFPARFVEKRNRRFEMRASGYNKTMHVPFVSGCFMFCRTETLKITNGFCGDYFMYCEDIDLCRRINLSGYKTVFFPEVDVIHAHRKASFKDTKMLRVHIKSAITYFNKWGWLFDKYRTAANREAENQY